jgi:hypothetical protein
MAPIARVVYKHRSRALHDGTPFPPSMCTPPFQENNWEAPMEYPLGLAMSSQQGTWLREQMPIHIHVFEYLVRHVLLKWWDSRIKAV